MCGISSILFALWKVMNSVFPTFKDYSLSEINELFVFNNSFLAMSSILLILNIIQTVSRVVSEQVNVSWIKTFDFTEIENRPQK